MHARSLRLLGVLLAASLTGLAGLSGTAASTTDTPSTEGHAIGHAATALGLTRVLPGSIPDEAIANELDENVADHLATDNGVGLISAAADSTSGAPFERAVAQAAPHGAATTGAPTAPRPAQGTLLQTALEDNAEPRAGDIEQPEPPPEILGGSSTLDGSVHARWSASSGPCVEPVAQSEIDAADLALGNAVLTVPDVAIQELDLPMSDELEPEGTLGTLGGLLAGTGAQEGTAGSLVSVPGGISARSVVTVTEAEDNANEVLLSTSTVQADSINILEGSPMGPELEVTRAPELSATSTGFADTSQVEYQPPELEATLDGDTLFELDSDEPSAEIPIGVPAEGFEDLPGYSDIADVPIVGGTAQSEDGELLPLTGEAQDLVLDLFVLRLSIAGLDEHSSDREEPYPGHQLGASARLLDVQLLPTQDLAQALADINADPPSSLSQISLGEQVATAYAPDGGVSCAPTDAEAVPGAGGEATQLAETGPASVALPLTLAGSLAVLLGVALTVAGTRNTASGHRPVKPSPHPRSPDGV